MSAKEKPADDLKANKDEEECNELNDFLLVDRDQIHREASEHLNKKIGNFYQRRPPSDPSNPSDPSSDTTTLQHDGQVMVRLQKGRFIVLDYSYLPTRADRLLASNIPHVIIKEGAGRTPCIRNDCVKVGIPTLLFDSAPEGGPSKYLTSGLCFTHQRELNSKGKGGYKKRRKRENESEGCLELIGLGGVDGEVFSLIEQEKARQNCSLMLKPGENFASRAVMDAMGTVMVNSCEGRDSMERLCRRRALEAFHLNEEDWGVNVQSLSLSLANFQVYTALLNTHDRILSLDVHHGGHPSHGYQTLRHTLSMTSRYFETMSYRLDETTGLIDYEDMERSAQLFRPKLIIAGANVYPRFIDYRRIRNIADTVGAYVLADISPISGLMANRMMPSCFPWVDVVTTSTHQSLRGPRGAMIFYRKGRRSETIDGEPIMYDLEDRINLAMRPGLQGERGDPYDHNNHNIVALAVALKEANTPDFVEYQHQVLKNCGRLTSELQKRGYDIVSGGSDNNVVLVDVDSTFGVDGERVERVLELACITAMKHSIPGDGSDAGPDEVPSGICLGTSAMTTRGFDEDDFATAAEAFHRGVLIAAKLKETEQGRTMEGFREMCDLGPILNLELVQLRKEVVELSMTYPAVGFAEKNMEIMRDYHSFDVEDDCINV